MFIIFAMARTKCANTLLLLLHNEYNVFCSVSVLCCYKCVACHLSLSFQPPAALVFRGGKTAYSDNNHGKRWKYGMNMKKNEVVNFAIAKRAHTHTHTSLQHISAMKNKTKNNKNNILHDHEYIIMRFKFNCNVVKCLTKRMEIFSLLSACLLLLLYFRCIRQCCTKRPKPDHLVCRDMAWYGMV